jgi:hypothetical protein
MRRVRTGWTISGLVGVAVLPALILGGASFGRPSAPSALSMSMSDASTTVSPALPALTGLTALPAPPVSRTVTVPQLPFGGTTIYPGRTLVAYYGTAGTGALGVLGEGSIPEMTMRLRHQAAGYARSDRPADIVYELIVTVADGSPGSDGDYSHDISRDKVETFIRAAHHNQALLVLDLQPGRSDFLTVAKRWKWALRDPWVSLALDPEWRMGPHQVPGQTIGSVGAREINQTSAWLELLTRANHLPEKLLMIHQFRTTMVRNIEQVLDRQHLVNVQHVDGFGTRAQKLATYHAVEQDPQFRMGFKLFYDEDINMFRPADVFRIRPRVRFVSYQ